ncbi:MAG: hypothetical protein Q4C10_03965 [Clostridia bacterium]|nr:hypothetical protein [Clostridia bacterium]
MLRFALKSMAVRKAKLIMTALSVIITASVALMAYNISTQVSEGIVNTAAKYDMIIGPSGSATQLAMNTMFFTDKPLGTIPYSVVEDLQNSGLVNQAIPFSMGDSYNAAPIVGTDAALLADKPLKSGAMFAQAMEAVVGYDVARQYGLSPGDSIVTSHGLGGSGEAHAASPLRVTGVLARTNTAYDTAVFTPISTIWALHDHEDEDHDADQGEALVEGQAAEGDHADAHGDDSPAGAGVHGDHGHAEEGEICAVLVRSTGFNAWSRLSAIYGGDSNYLAINPNTVLREVMDNVDLSRRIVYILCAVILVMNLFVVSVIALLNMVDSRREISLMRLIGISMKKINRLYLIQNALAGLAAAALSLGLSRLCLLAIRRFVASMGIVLDAARIYPMEWVILLAVFLLSILPTAVCTHSMSRRATLEA